MRPLEGVTVVTLEQAVAAPFATRQLADLGARVLKIERTGTGDFARGYDESVKGLAANFVWLNRSKESVALDLKHPRALEIVKRMLARADVFVQNLSPGAAARLGLSGEQLQAELPRLIVCEVSGYGDTGPYRDKKAYDLLIQAEAGLIGITGTPDSPAKTGISTADIAAGMYAYSGILCALYQREKTGRGSLVKVSMFDALCEWMLFPLYYNHFGATPFVAAGAGHPAIYPYGPFPTADGKTVLIGIQNEREWKLLCERVLNRPELAGDSRFNSVSRRVANQEILHPVLERAFRQLAAADLICLLDEVGIATARLNDLETVWNHPQLTARERWRTVDSPAGRIPALVPPGIPCGVEPRMDPIPALGQHTAAVLMELGYTPSEIGSLKQEKVVDSNP